MTTLRLGTLSGTVPYHLEAGALSSLPEVVAKAFAGRPFVVSDTTVGPLWARGVAEALDAPYLEVPAGEVHKRWETVERVASWLLGWGVERQDGLVAVGGGVVTDLVGFAASVMLRGIPWVAVPTTLLGMVDAAVGGKTGIDLDLGKNLLGTFWQPRAVVADPSVLRTLDRRQLRAGLVEVVKAAMIATAGFEHVVDSHLAAVARGEVERSGELITAAVRLKAEIVGEDEREAGPRAALNLGHTLGHALEGATAYQRFLHGEAVGWGLLAALRLARDRGYLSTVAAQSWAARLSNLAPWPSLAGVEWSEVAPFLARDKKRRGGRTGWVLPRFGGVVLDVPVTMEEVDAVFSALRELAPEGPFTVLF